MHAACALCSELVFSMKNSRNVNTSSWERKQTPSPAPQTIVSQFSNFPQIVYSVNYTICKLTNISQFWIFPICVNYTTHPVCLDNHIFVWRVKTKRPGASIPYPRRSIRWPPPPRFQCWKQHKFQMPMLKTTMSCIFSADMHRFLSWLFHIMCRHRLLNGDLEVHNWWQIIRVWKILIF